MSRHTQHSRFPQSGTAEGVRALPSRTVCSLIQTQAHILLTMLREPLLSSCHNQGAEARGRGAGPPVQALLLFLPLRAPSKKGECLRDSGRLADDPESVLHITYVTTQFYGECTGARRPQQLLSAYCVLGTMQGDPSLWCWEEPRGRLSTRETRSCLF